MVGCMFREDVYTDVCSHNTHIVQRTYPILCRWCVLVSDLSVLHRFFPQFGYISLIVALPYSFKRGARLLHHLLSGRRCSYFVHKLCKSAVFINIVTVMETCLSGSRGFDLRKGMGIYPFQIKTFVVVCSVGVKRYMEM